MKVLALVFLLMPFILLATVDAKSELNRVYTMTDAENIEGAFDLAMELQEKVPVTDPYFPTVVDRCIDLGSYLGYQHQTKAEFDLALKYNLDVYNTMLRHRSVVSAENLGQEYVLINDILEGYFSKGNFEEADKYRKLLYQAHDRNELPKSYDYGDFWFDFFKEGKYNIRGYEKFAPLPVDRFSTSFSKIIYHITSTKKDGSDKKEVFQLHVLMFHSDSAKFDYVMTWRKIKKGSMNSYTLYQYTYDENIDYSKLHSDIREAVKLFISEM